MQVSAGECGLLTATALPDRLPPARGNRFGDNEDAAKLGFALFFDARALAQPGSDVSCARCHAPERDFADDLPLSLGVARTARNAPALVNAARSFPHFWDGRADSLWSQPLATIENPDEMNGTRLGVAHFIADNYADAYRAAFGALPDLSDATRFPAQGKPGLAAWDAMAADDQRTIDQVYVNVGKALEAYDRKLATGPSSVDRFLAGSDTLTATAQKGLRLFVQAGCLGCHGGPYFSDGKYHDLDLPVPSYVAATAGDPGRARGITLLMASEFNALGPYYDRPPGEPPALGEDVSTTGFDPTGAFLTPSLRNVGDTGPYGHNGAFITLDEVVRFHLAGGGPRCHDPLLVPHPLGDDEVAALVELLNALHGDTAPLPWSFWPPVK